MRKIFFTVISPLSWFISCLIPKDHQKIAFGAWGGKMFMDNPKYLYLGLKGSDSYEIRWIGNPEIKKFVPEGNHAFFLKKDTLASWWFLMRAGTWVCCQGVNDLTDIAVHGGNVRIVNFWHGIPLKFMGVMSPGRGKNSCDKGWYRQTLHYLARIIGGLVPSATEYVSSSSPDMTTIMEKCFPDRFSHKRMFPFGSPRMDYLIHNSDNETLRGNLKEKYSKILGFDKDCRIVLYAPTWRLSGSKIFTFSGMDTSDKIRLSSVLHDNSAVVIEKLHPNTYRLIHQNNDINVSIKNVIEITPEQLSCFDIQEFMLITDVLVTDYSSLYFDFATLRRPCCHFVYDLDDYINRDSGLAYDLRDVAGGPLLEDISSLITYITVTLKDPKFEPADGLSRLMEYETGNACTQFCDRLLSSRS